ncbi:MAG: hypothetical protein ACR2F1_11805 [Nitrososphaeraceae archaeon]
MDKLNITKKEEEKEIGNQVEIIHFRAPKKNHDAMILFCKQFNSKSLLCKTFFKYHSESQA